jgi:hypothetical protein
LRRVLIAVLVRISFIFLVRLGFELCACKAGSLPLELHLQSIFFLVVVGNRVSCTLCLGLP